MLQQITKRIFYMEGEERTDRPYIYYINGDNYSVAIDAGNSKRHVEKFYEKLEDANLRKPDYTIITHWHWDHTFGMHAVAGKTIASYLTNEKLRQVMNWEWTKEKMKEREETGQDISFCNTCIKREYRKLKDIVVVPAEIEVNDTMSLDLGGVHCELKVHDSTHSRDSLFIYVPEEKALIVGDADSEDLYENQGKYDQTRLKDLISFIEEYDFTTYLIGHDIPEQRKKTLKYLKSMQMK